MAITLGAYTFDADRIVVSEQYREEGGQEGRIVEMKGVLEGFSSLSLLESELDALLRAASESGDATALSLREGRRLWVRRNEFKAEIQREALIASFMLGLEAEDPCEEAITETELSWTITASGAEKAVTTVGSTFCLPVISLTASGTITDPVFSDGERSIAYAGDVADGESLVFNGPEGRVWLEDEDVTPYTDGLFPRIDPDGATLTYTDESGSSHNASVTIQFRDRWW